MTYEILGSATVLGLDVGFASLVDNLEGPVGHVLLDVGVAGKLSKNKLSAIAQCKAANLLVSPADETLSIEDGVLGVHRGLVLGGIANQALLRGERDVGRRRPVTLCAKLSKMHS